MENKIVQLLARQLQDNFDGDNWLDENFDKKLKKVTAENAFVRPLPEMHSVAELVAHLLIWREEGVKKLSGKRPTINAESPESWRNNDSLRSIGWARLKSDLANCQKELMALLKDKSDAFLEDNDYVPGYSYQYVLEGLIHHDIYHLGQIGITLKFL